MRGQEEIGAGGFHHWQLYLVLFKQQRLSWLRERWPGIHWEPTRSVAAESYVWKDETAVEGTRFELGNKPFKRNSLSHTYPGKPIGIEYVKTRKMGNLKTFPRMYIFDIMELSSELAQTMLNRLLWSEVVSCTGAKLELVKVIEPGKSLGHRLIVKIPSRNGGVAIEVKRMLLSMNFGALSTYHTFYDGVIAIRSLWKPKAVVHPCVPRRSFSQAIYTPENGTQTWIPRQETPSSEGSKSSKSSVWDQAYKGKRD